MAGFGSAGHSSRGLLLGGLLYVLEINAVVRRVPKRIALVHPKTFHGSN